MKTYKKILAAVDFSKYSSLVVEHAATLAYKLDAELILINVINKRDTDMIKYTHQVLKLIHEKNSIEELIEKLHKDREKKMADLIAKSGISNMKTRFMIRTGIPLKEIINAINEVGADMVFIASKGKTDLMDVLIGSTTQQLVRSCPATLTIVKPNKSKKTS